MSQVEFPEQEQPVPVAAPSADYEMAVEEPQETDVGEAMDGIVMPGADHMAESPHQATRRAVRPTPVGTRGRTSLALPAFWLMIGLLTFGTWRMTALFATALRAYPTATIVAAVLFTLYAVPFVIVVRSIDFLEREPPLLLAAALGWGGTVATTTAISGNDAVRDLLAKLVSPGFAAVWGPAISAPAIEEVLKTLGVVIVVLVARKQVNSVIDGAVYGAFVGLGFQVVEDFVYAVNAVAVAGRGDSAGPVVVTFFLRGFLGGLWSHTLFSALAGAGVAYFVVNRARPFLHRFGVTMAYFFGAWAFHFLWNSPWLADGFGYGALGVLGALLVKGLPALLMIALLVRSASGNEADFYLSNLIGDPEVATAKELAVLRTGRRRIAARRYAYARCGRTGARTVRALQRAQARLAVELSRGGADAARLRREAVVHRYRLIALRHPEAAAPPERRAAWGSWLVGVGLSAAIAIAVAVAINALGGG